MRPWSTTTHPFAAKTTERRLLLRGSGSDSSSAATTATTTRTEHDDKEEENEEEEDARNLQLRATYFLHNFHSGAYKCRLCKKDNSDVKPGGGRRAPTPAPLSMEQRLDALSVDASAHITSALQLSTNPVSEPRTSQCSGQAKHGRSNKCWKERLRTIKRHV